MSDATTPAAGGAADGAASPSILAADWATASGTLEADGMASPTILEADWAAEPAAPAASGAASSAAPMASSEPFDLQRFEAEIDVIIALLLEDLRARQQLEAQQPPAEDSAEPSVVLPILEDDAGGRAVKRRRTEDTDQ